MAYENILYEVKEGVAVLTVNRPKAMNALNNATWKEIADVITKVEKDNNVKALIITGAGNRAFVAGVDITELLVLEGEALRKHSETMHENQGRIEKLGKPVIAGVNGVAFGGGFELALSCHLRVASEHAAFGLPETGLGALPGAGGTQRLPRVIGKSQALYYLLTGESIKAQDALRLGLVNKVVAPDEVMTYCFAIAKVIASKAPLATKYVMEAVEEGLKVDLDSGLKIELDLNMKNTQTADFKEGTSAFTQKRTPVWKGK